MRFTRQQSAPSATIDLRQTARRPPRKLRKFLRFRRPFLLAAAAVLILAAGYGLWLHFAAQSPATSPQGLIKAVSKDITLPPGEDPVVATVTDNTKLTSQPFLAQAQNGDRLLIYTKAKKVYIYRPSLHKLVDVGPVSISASDLSQ